MSPQVDLLYSKLGHEGFGKVNRLAVEENENKLMCIAKMEQSTGRVEAEKIREVLVERGVAEKIIACGFDTTSSNIGVNKGCCSLILGYNITRK